jgi:hypothetical protein
MPPAKPDRSASNWDYSSRAADPRLTGDQVIQRLGSGLAVCRRRRCKLRVSRLRPATNIQSKRAPCAEAKAYIADNRCAVADTKFDRRGILRIRGMHIDKSWLQESITRASRMHGVTIMHKSHRIAVGIATAVGLILLSGLPAQAPAQTAGAPTAAQANATGMECNGTRILDPFKGKLAGPDLPPGLLPIAKEVRDSIFVAGLPCQENVTPFAQNKQANPVDPDGKEDVGLDNLQRGFDFYSWRTFIALNSPADGTPIDQAQPDTPTRWENVDNFKQLLDVMLPPKSQPPKWPTDKAERERLMPEECRALDKQFPKTMIVKMIEESFNEPFKTGPLIDQQGHYAIFDILMNRQMFKYITDNHLNTKAGQMSAANSGLLVDFPPGHNDTPGTPGTPGTNDHTLGAFMLKVSWKILSPDEIKAKNFHMVKALVLMPPGDPKAKRPCLAETLGLIGFHAVHKTVGRPQWIWTSFEHVKNVPDKDEVANNKLAGPYNFFSVNCKDNCPAANATPPRPWDPDPALQLKFRKDDSFKSQIVRETPLTNAAKHMNDIFHSMLPAASVWQNYMLLSTQWPTVPACTSLHSQSSDAPAPKTDFLKQPDMTCSPAPTFFANSTLETYSQTESDGGVPLATSSCIACHGNAVSFQTRPSTPKSGEVILNQSDFTFMLEKAQ